MRHLHDNGWKQEIRADAIAFLCQNRHLAVLGLRAAGVPPPLVDTARPSAPVGPARPFGADLSVDALPPEPPGLAPG